MLLPDELTAVDDISAELELPVAADEVGAVLLDVALEAGAELLAVEEVGVALLPAGVEVAPPEPALADAQEQTARAEDETSRPVTAPQALSTQFRAALAMAADCELLHWQAKSVDTQPTAEPADSMQEV